jgi:hypothetical protein
MINSETGGIDYEVTAELPVPVWAFWTPVHDPPLTDWDKFDLVWRFGREDFHRRLQDKGGSMIKRLIVIVLTVLAFPAAASAETFTATETVQVAKIKNPPKGTYNVYLFVGEKELTQRFRPPCNAYYTGSGVSANVRVRGCKEGNPLVIRYVSFNGEKKLKVKIR